jgi:hypothetical protein
MGVAADLQSLRTRYQAIAMAVYNDRCSIVRVTESDDNRGGWTDTTATPYTGIPCTFVPRKTNQREVVVSGQLEGYADGDVWLPARFAGALLNVKENDRIVMAANGTEPARTLEIIFPAPHQGILIQAAVRFVSA